MNPINLHLQLQKCLLIFFIFFHSCIQLSSQKTGIVSGKIIDKTNAEAMIGATVQLEGTNIGAATDFDGNYKLEAVPGNYNLILRYVGYEPAILQIEIKEKEITHVEFAMEESQALALQEIVVVANAARSSDVVMNLELKKASFIASGITASEIRKTPDRTVGDILKRVTGASIQEGRFAIIRGMNDRYNAGYLDGAMLSSSESDRKAFAFDVVPANLIDNLMIIKTGSADLCGDFGGGVIKINTKSVPDKLTQTISVGVQSHSLTSGKDFIQSKTYSSEEFNILSQSRKIPSFEEGKMRISSLFPSNADKIRLAEQSKLFNNDWSSSKFNPGLNTRLAYSIGFPVNLGEGKLGVIMALNYADTRKSSESTILTYDDSDKASEYNDQSYLRNITTGGIFNINYTSKNMQINWHNLLNINSDNNTIQRTGIANYSDYITVNNTANLVNYNKLYNGIISLKKLVGDSILNINASVSYSNVHREIPDYKIINYTKTEDFSSYQLAMGDFFNSSTGRFYSNLDENLYGANIELSKKIKTRIIKTELKLGYAYQNRDRNFWSRSFVYGGSPDELSYNPAIDLGNQNISADKLFLIEKTSNDLAYYHGHSILHAVYACADQNINNKFRAVYGIRLEDLNLNVENQKVNSAIADIEKMSVLPSMNLTYSLNEKTNIRASYFASLNRPEFRELAPFSFFVFDKNAEIRGNKNLQPATLNNFDLRYEWYPTGGEMISIGGFYKSIKSPIELSLDITQTFSTFIFQNEQAADIYGVELELKKRLDFISDQKFFKYLAVYSNLSIIKSSLHFNEGSKSKNDRPLQGQSPYIVNARLQYENPDNGWSCNISLNKIGRRIAFVGVAPEFGNTRQDIYEAARSVIDLQIGKTFNNLNFKLTIGDLFHQDQVYYQDVDDNSSYNENHDRLMFNFSNGYTASLSASYNF